MAKIVVKLTDTRIKAEIAAHKKVLDKPKKLSDGGGLYLYLDINDVCCEIAGDFHLGDFRQLTDRNLLPFDLVF